MVLRDIEGVAAAISGNTNGDELVTNGAFTGGISGWTKVSNISFDNGGSVAASSNRIRFITGADALGLATGFYSTTGIQVYAGHTYNSSITVDSGSDIGDFSNFQLWTGANGAGFNRHSFGGFLNSTYPFTTTGTFTASTTEILYVTILGKGNIGFPSTSKTYFLDDISVIDQDVNTLNVDRPIAGTSTAISNTPTSLDLIVVQEQPGGGFQYFSNDDGTHKGSDHTLDLNVFRVGVSASVKYDGWVLFRNLFIPQGATIFSAILRLKTRDAGVGSDVNISIDIEDIDDPSVIASDTSYHTGLANITGSPTDLVVQSSTPQNTILFKDVTALLQVVIDRGGWTEGNFVRFFLDGGGNTDIVRFENANDDFEEPQLLLLFDNETPLHVLRESLGSIDAITGPNPIEISIAVDADDGSHSQGSHTFTTTGNLQIGQNGTNKDIWFTFKNISLEQGQRVPHCELQLLSLSSIFGGSTVNQIIQAEDADDATAITTDGIFDGLALTTAKLDVVLVPAASTLYSFDVSSILQEVIDRGSWVSGNDINIIMLDNVSPTNNFVTFAPQTTLLLIHDKDNSTWLSYTGGTGEGISPEHDIYATAFNIMRNQANQLYSTGSTDFGYGATALTIPPIKSSAQDITSTNITDLRNLINAMSLHSGGNPVMYYPPTTDLQVTDVIFGDDWDEMKKALSQTQGRRFDLGVGEFETILKITDVRTTQWGVGVISIINETTVTFVDSDDARFFFNGGGRVEIESTGTNPIDSTQDLNWQTLLSNMGRISMGHTAVAEETGAMAGTPTAIGFYDLTTSYQGLYSSEHGTGAYTDNVVNWAAKLDVAHPNAKVITFRVLYSDLHPNTWTDDTVDLDVTLDYYMVRSNNNIVSPTPTYATDRALED